MDWFEFAVHVDQEAVEPVSELFARYGYNSGVVVEEPIIPEADEDYRIDPDAPVLVRTYIQADEKAEETRQKVAEALWFLGTIRKVGPLEVRPMRAEDWENAWKANYQTHRIGRRFVIKPSWLEHDSASEDLVIELDPGMAFGTGLHPTTRLCLAALEDYVSESTTNVLDLGTGSGILAIGALRLNPAANVWALDTDQLAVDVSIENVARNGLADRIEVAKGSLLPGVEPDVHFDLIVANILARVIIDLASALYDALVPGGVVITSGIIDTRGPDVDAALRRAGLELIETRQDGDWLAMIARRNA